MFTPEQIEMLKAKLDATHVKTRKQANRPLSYIEGWHAIAEANRIFGFDCWHRETVEFRCVSERERKIGSEGRTGWGVSYIAKVRVRVGSEALSHSDVIREGLGAGHGIDVDLGLAHESALKEAETDAMKRALMTFGNPFGLALYDKQQAEVERSRSSDGTEHRASNARVAGSSPAETAKPRTTKEWIEDAKAAIRACKSQAEIDAWETANADKLAWLQEKHPSARLDLGNLMAERWQALEPANA